jgi:hypothetical protein
VTGQERELIATLIRLRSRTELDELMLALHRKYHDQPLAHVGVHRAWMRVHASRRSYFWMLAHAFAGYVVAAPASLVQRYTGLAVPAFRDDAHRNAASSSALTATSSPTPKNASRSNAPGSR